MILDLGKTWDQAVRLLAANRDLLWIVAGAFLFLPSLALSVLAPAAELESAAQNPDQMQAALIAYLAQYWPHIAFYIVLNFVGSLAILAMLGKRHRPTVGEAIVTGIVGFVPYLMTIVISGFAAAILLVAASLIGAATGVVAIGAALAVLTVVIVIAFGFRLVLAGPIVAIERQLNPLVALVRSWNLVKGNTRRVALLVLLIFVVAIVVSVLVSAVLGLLSALASAEVALWLEGIGSGLLGAAISVIMLAVYAAIYHQLSGQIESVSETFE